MQTLNEKAISIGQQLIGRDAHVAELLAEFKRAAAGHGSMALIRGDGGIGKSRLANEVLARVAPMGAVVMIGHAASADRGTPYALVRDLLGNVPRDAPADVVDRTRRLADLIEIGDPQDRSGARPHALLSAVVELIERITDRDPLVMVWEDLHAADADSLSLFMRLARQLSARRALLIGSMRERSGAETAELDRLVEQLELDGRGIVVDVGPLDRSDVHALVAQVIGVSPDQSIVDLVFESSRGNPFFATETARSLVASSSVALDGGKARLLEHQPVLRPRTALVHRFFQVGSNDAHVARIISAFGRVSGAAAGARRIHRQAARGRHDRMLRSTRCRAAAGARRRRPIRVRPQHPARGAVRRRRPGRAAAPAPVDRRQPSPRTRSRGGGRRHRSRSARVAVCRPRRRSGRGDPRRSRASHRTNCAARLGALVRTMRAAAAGRLADAHDDHRVTGSCDVPRLASAGGGAAGESGARTPARGGGPLAHAGRDRQQPLHLR